jgi:actin-related protein
MSNINLLKPIVIENGSESYRVGFGGENQPFMVFKIGDSSINKKTNSNITEISPSILKIKRDPMEQGQIINYDELILVWNFIFKEILKVDPSQHPVLLVDPPLNSFITQEKLIEIIFDHFKVPKFSLKSAPELIMNMMGNETGIVIDVQQEKIDFSVVWDYELIRSDFLQMNVGIINFDQQLPSICDRMYQQIKKIKLLCHGGVELRKICAQNIVLTGVGSHIPMIKERLTQLFMEIDLKNGGKPLEFIITSPKDPENAVWKGGSIFTTQKALQKNWITFEEFQDNGPQIVHRL